MHDSLERCLGHLSLLDSRSLTYHGRPVTRYQGRVPLRVQPSMFRRFDCVDGCWACCMFINNITLDFGEFEMPVKALGHPAFTPRIEVINGVSVKVYSAEKLVGCEFLGDVRTKGKGCTFFPNGPVECIAAVNMRVTEKIGSVDLTKQPIARAWRMKPTPECEFRAETVAEMDLESNIRIFERYLAWARVLNLDVASSRLDTLISTFSAIVEGRREPVQFVVD